MDTLLYELHQPASGLYDLGLPDGRTWRDFDAAQLPPLAAFSAPQIKQLRLRVRASQAVFAAYLNTSISTVQKWEIGDRKPRGPALRLLELIERKGLAALEIDA